MFHYAHWLAHALRNALLHLHPLKSSSFEDTQREELRGMLVAQAEIWHIDLDMDICWTVLGRNYKTILS